MAEMNGGLYRLFASILLVKLGASRQANTALTSGYGIGAPNEPERFAETGVPFRSTVTRPSKERHGFR